MFYIIFHLRCQNKFQHILQDTYSKHFSKRYVNTDNKQIYQLQFLTFIIIFNVHCIYMYCVVCMCMVSLQVGNEAPRYSNNTYFSHPMSKTCTYYLYFYLRLLLNLLLLTSASKYFNSHYWGEQHRKAMLLPLTANMYSWAILYSSTVRGSGMRYSTDITIVAKLCYTILHWYLFFLESQGTKHCVLSLYCSLFHARWGTISLFQ